MKILLVVYRISVALLLLVGLAFFALWAIGFLPYSVNEALFRLRLSAFADSKTGEIMISDLARFDWEIVCENHPYNGPLIVEKSGRSYDAPARMAQDGLWVLVFIRPDGSPVNISGSCKRGGADIRFREKRCLKRNAAQLKLLESGKCTIYGGVESSVQK